MPHRSVIILPDDTGDAIVQAIGGAKTSIHIKMFVFSSPVLLDAVIAARQRGVAVKVMLNPARRNGEQENEAARKKLLKAGIEVKNSNPQYIITHEKSMVIDEELAFVKSLNWETKNLTETRDYAVITTHATEVKEVMLCFNADWHRKNFTPDENSQLIWCSINGRKRIAEFIDKTKHTLFIQNERFQDMVIIERIVRAAKRGVKVHIMARPPHTLKDAKLVEGVEGLRILHDVGIKIHKLKHLQLHGKLLLADDRCAVIGSINLTPGSFDHRRELAIEVHDEEIIARLNKIARHDWKHSHKLDLSDEAILSDLQKHDKDGAEKLVLKVKEKKHPGN